MDRLGFKDLKRIINERRKEQQQLANKNNGQETAELLRKQQQEIFDGFRDRHYKAYAERKDNWFKKHPTEEYFSPTYEETIKETKLDEWVYEFILEADLKTPDQRYQELKKHRYAHDPYGGGWYWHGRQDNTAGPCETNGCVPECRYYLETGRIEKFEVLSWYKDYEGYSDVLNVYQVLE